MNKYLFICLLSIVLVSCKSTSKSVATSPSGTTKLDQKSESALKGNWTLTSVTYSGSEMFKINSFNIADSQCLVGSTWKLVSNNNTGEMALNNSGCTAYGSRITWFINKDGNFTMKFLEEGVKAKHSKAGYVLKVANPSTDSFQLVDTIDIGGRMTEVVYQFQRTN